MKFKIRQENLKNALNVIKGSKSLGKSDGEDQALIRIKAEKDPEATVSFLASNIGVWASSNISESHLDGNNKKDIFQIEEAGEVFVDGASFISLMSTYPADGIIEFVLKKNDDDNSSLLVASCKESGKKGRVKTSSFLIEKPVYFEEEPPTEQRTMYRVAANELSEAINSVEFASGTDSEKQQFWGVQVEVFDTNDLSAVATDKIRICWYDKKGNERDQEPLAVLNCVKSSFVSALKCMDLSDPVDIEIGTRYSIFKQKNQWHGIPNTTKVQDEEMPDCRAITQMLDDNCTSVFKLTRKTLVDCIKSAMLTSCGKYGIHIDFNSNKKQVKYSVNNVDSGAVMKSSHEEIEYLDASQMSGESIEYGIVLPIESLKDILNKYKSDLVEFKLIDSHSPVQIIDQDANFRFIASVIV